MPNADHEPSSAFQPALFEMEEAKAADSLLIRPDRNLEKWPIWEPSNSRHQARERTLQRELRLPDGSVVVARVEVGSTNKGVLTTEDQKTFYALIKVWEEKGKTTEPVYFSRQQLARILKKSWGSKVNRALTESLLRLRATPFFWERSYYDSATSETVERITAFNILAELELIRRSRGEMTTAEASYFRFNDRILANLRAGFTRPVFLDTILSFRSEIAQILYTHLDFVLSDKTQYERRTRELFADLGIDGTTYRYPSKRAEMLEPALRELEGVPLPTGMIREARLERTVDRQDFKIVVRKGRGRPALPPKTEPPAPSQSAELLPPVVTAVVTQPAPPKNAPAKSPRRSKSGESIAPPSPAQEETFPEPLLAAATEQVRHFYQIFFQSGQTAHPTAKEIALARDHVARLGEEAAQYLVQFAYREAKKTNFAIQAYGGIAQYEGRAIGEYQAQARQREQGRLKKAREGHYARFLAAYCVYLEECFVRLSNAPTKAFQAFLEEESRNRERLAGSGSAFPVARRLREDYDTAERRLARFREFLAEELKAGRRLDGVLTFWEWDNTHNPERFAGEIPASDTR